MKTVPVLLAFIAAVGATLQTSTRTMAKPVPEKTISSRSHHFENHHCNPETIGKLTPNDTRVRYTSAEIHGNTYYYRMGVPESVPPIGTIFLIHGFPDLGFGWRYQVPYLMCLGYRVVVPDMLGYAGSSRPDDLHQMTLKRMSADMKELADQIVSGEKIILGGHDWGGHLVWRIAMWQPSLVKGIFSICSPLLPPMKPYIPIEDLIKGQLKNFGYILHFRGPEIENAVREQNEVRQFLNAMFGGLDSQGEPVWQATRGVLLDKLPFISKTPWLSDDELSYYAEQFMLQKHPRLRGPLNWYRTLKMNGEEELALLNHSITLTPPALFIAALRDESLPVRLSAGMEEYVPHLTRAEVNSSHWALWEKSTQVSLMIGKWLQNDIASAQSSTLKGLP